MIRVILLLMFIISVGIAKDEISGIPLAGDGGMSSLVGEFSISPAANDMTVSTAGESLTAHSGIIMTEASPGDSNSGASVDGDDANDDLYDKDKKDNGNDRGGQAENPLQWWTKSNMIANLHFMSTLNPS